MSRLLISYLVGSFLESTSEPGGEEGYNIDWSIEMKYQLRQQKKFKVGPRDGWTETREHGHHLKKGQFTKFTECCWER